MYLNCLCHLSLRTNRYESILNTEQCRELCQGRSMSGFGAQISLTTRVNVSLSLPLSLLFSSLGEERGI